MSRSIWKGPINLKTNKNLRTTTITPNWIGKTLYSHNGKYTKGVTITNNHIGYKLGEFILTKTVANYNKK